MISSNSFNNKTFLIIGMGLTGRSLCTALSKSKANIFYWDDDSKSEKSLRRLRAKKLIILYQVLVLLLVVKLSIN